MGVCLALCVTATISVMVVWAPIVLHCEMKDAAGHQQNRGTDHLCCLEIKGFSSIDRVIRTYLRNKSQWHKSFNGFQQRSPEHSSRLVLHLYFLHGFVFYICPVDEND